MRRMTRTTVVTMSLILVILVAGFHVVSYVVSNYRSLNIRTRLHFPWPNRNRISNETRPFRNGLTSSERATLLAIFGAVTDALRGGNVTFWIDGGTLLGSYRHHNLIPWDDDVDLVFRRSQMRQARRAIESLAPEYRLYTENDGPDSAEHSWRVFPSTAGVPVPGKRFRFPAVDLIFYGENATYVWIDPYNVFLYNIWHRTTVFPLHLRPFDGYWVPSPCDVETYLMSWYGPRAMDECMSRKVTHRTFTDHIPIYVPCSKLLRGIPVVKRKHNGNGSVTETLVRGGKIIHQHVILRKC